MIKRVVHSPSFHKKLGLSEGNGQGKGGGG